jgi:hypothetical protein
MYGLTLLAISLLGSALDAHARYEYLYSPAKEGEELHSTQRNFLPAVIGYMIAILIGLAQPAAAVALYCGLAVYLVVPLREAARVLRRRHSTRSEPRLGTRSGPGCRPGDARRRPPGGDAERMLRPVRRVRVFVLPSRSRRSRGSASPVRGAARKYAHGAAWHHLGSGVSPVPGEPLRLWAGFTFNESRAFGAMLPVRVRRRDAWQASPMTWLHAATARRMGWAARAGRG